jgi:hypothetical protein
MTFAMSQPPKATLAEQINTTGFRRWHEYELTRSFGYLGLGVLTLFVALAMLEGVFAAPVRLEGGIRLILSFVCLWVTGWAWLRFMKILVVAESISRQVVCDQCERYGLIRIIYEDLKQEHREHHMVCQCKKCDYIWQLAYTLQLPNARV